MFYCDSCRVDNNWPTSMLKSAGNCEICGQRGLCNDRPSSQLPKKAVATVSYTRTKYVCADYVPKDKQNNPVGKKASYMDWCADCRHHVRGYVVESQRTVAAANFVATLAVNVDNADLSDAQFRDLIRNTLPIVIYDGAEA